MNSTPGTVDSAVLVAAEHDKVRVSGVGVLPKCVGASVGVGPGGGERVGVGAVEDTFVWSKNGSIKSILPPPKIICMLDLHFSPVI